MKKLKILLAVALALSLTSVALADLTLPTGTGVSNVIVQNLSPTAGDTATVHVDYYDTEGNKDATSDTTVGPLGVAEIKTDANVTPALPDGWAGSAVLSSDKEVGAVVSVRWSNTGNEAGTFDTNQRSQDAYVGGAQGSNSVYLPDLKRVPNCPTNSAKANQVSQFYVQNTEGTAATVYVNFYNRQGAFEGVVTGSIPAYSQKTWNMRIDSQMPAGVVDGFGTTNDGAALITSTNKIFAIAQTTWCAGWDAAYEGVGGGDTTLYAPIAFRTKTSSTSWNLYSAVVVQNPNATPITAYFNYINRDTGNVDLQVQRTIQPNSATGLNTRTGGDVPATTFDVLVGSGSASVPNWAGSVLVTSTLPIVGSSNVIWFNPSQNYSGAYVMKGPSLAGEKIYAPAYYRRNTGGWGTGSQWSALILQNTENVTRSMTINFVNQAGTTVYSKAIQVGPNAGFGVNSRNGGNGAAASITAAELQTNLGDSFIGGVYVVAAAGSKFVGAVNIVYYDRSSVYNAFVK